MKNNLEDRLSEFAIQAGKIRHCLEKNTFTTNLYHQLVRSTSSVSLNYAESRSAESTRDFVHKLSICLKELRESKRNLTLMANSESIENIDLQEKLLKENEELIAILAKSIITSKKNNPTIYKQL